MSHVVLHPLHLTLLITLTLPSLVDIATVVDTAERTAQNSHDQIHHVHTILILPLPPHLHNLILLLLLSKSLVLMQMVVLKI